MFLLYGEAQISALHEHDMAWYKYTLEVLSLIYVVNIKQQNALLQKKAGDFMLWSDLFDDGHEPLAVQIREFVDTPLWDDLADSLQETYNVQPKLFYSCCTMQQGYWKGWNIKYKKRGRALCTLYPKQGYFVALIPVGAKEQAEADLLIPLCSTYTQNIYSRTASGKTGKSLAIEVTNENILHDVKSLVALRVSAS